MKKLLFFSLLLISFSSIAQTDTYKAENEGWLVKLDEAYELSQKTGKPILANFTGSDWCGWCKRLTKSVFAKKDFQSWADENVILLELDFPKRKQLPEEIRNQNAQLQQVFKVRGYPTVWLFNLEKDDEGKFNIEGLGKTGYRKTVEEFTNDVERMMANKNGK